MIRKFTTISKLPLILTLFTVLSYLANSQESKPAEMEKPGSGIVFTPFDGIIIAGYTDKGAFLNFTGPNLSIAIRNSKLLLGMLPSLRYKKDNGLFRNSPITPTLGIGLTYCYKKIAVQVPLYYNAKTAVSNGRWNIGIGVGMRLKY